MTIFLLIFLILLVIYSFLIDFYRRSWKQIPVHDIKYADVSVSVIIAVRNEEKNVAELVETLQTQLYPKEKFEVVFVDDHSSDKTISVLKSKRVEMQNMIISELPEGICSKKKAIEAGIRIANGDLIITTDADCRMGASWIKSFASFYKSTGASFIAAPVNMWPGNSLRGIFQSLDFIAMQAITGASIFKYFHTMCNGANLAYSKQAFIDVNGFAGIDQIPSGDDMLLMYKIFSLNPEKVLYMKNREAIVTTSPETSWKSFLHQRIRWASKAVHYKDKNLFYVLALTYLLNICFLVLAIASIIKVSWLGFLLLFMLGKILIEFPFVNSAAIFFSQHRLMKYFPFLQPLHILYVVISGWLGRFGSYEWKARIIKNKGNESLVKQ
jgi:cellulose synthase/poly-beta-1,6-N-acetylglucosamine synthase-like glycosyltransferase